MESRENGIKRLKSVSLFIPAQSAMSKTYKNNCIKIKFEPVEMVLQFTDKLDFGDFHNICSRRNSITDSENSDMIAQDSPPSSSPLDRKMTYWSIQRGKQSKYTISSF